jgi:sodium-coupled neutral amino acid transporter 11
MVSREYPLMDYSAFGGMLAFCVIVGDTIPKVMDALFPSLSDTSFLWLLTDRRAVMILLILGISYPLSLYRDIAKASTPWSPMQPHC